MSNNVISTKEELYLVRQYDGVYKYLNSPGSWKKISKAVFPKCSANDIELCCVFDDSMVKRYDARKDRWQQIGFVPNIIGCSASGEYFCYYSDKNTIYCYNSVAQKTSILPQPTCSMPSGIKKSKVYKMNVGAGRYVYAFVDDDVIVEYDLASSKWKCIKVPLTYNPLAIEVEGWALSSRVMMASPNGVYVAQRIYDNNMLVDYFIDILRWDGSKWITISEFAEDPVAPYKVVDFCTNDVGSLYIKRRDRDRDLDVVESYYKSGNQYHWHPLPALFTNAMPEKCYINGIYGYRNTVIASTLCGENLTATSGGTYLYIPRKPLPPKKPPIRTPVGQRFPNRRGQ